MSANIVNEILTLLEELAKKYGPELISAALSEAADLVGKRVANSVAAEVSAETSLDDLFAKAKDAADAALSSLDESDKSVRDTLKATSGWDVENPMATVCPDCNGAGYKTLSQGAHETCTTCKGSGSVLLSREKLDAYVV